MPIRFTDAGLLTGRTLARTAPCAGSGSTASWSFESGKSARAVKNLSLAEDHFADHFPGYPVMPAALILEGLAQTGGILVGEANDSSEKVVLAKVPRAVFHREMLAGEQLVYEAEIAAPAAGGSSVSGRVLRRTGMVTAEAEIFFAHLDQSRSQAAVRRPQFRLQRRDEVPAGRWRKRDQAQGEAVTSVTG